MQLSDLPERVNGDVVYLPENAVHFVARAERRISKGERERTQRARENTLSAFEQRSATVPHNIEAEQALLGAMLIDNQALDQVSAFLLPEHFFEPVHGRIYEVAGALIGAGERADPITLRTFFEAAEPISPELTVPQYLGRLAANATTIMNAADYGRLVHDLATRRDLQCLGMDVAAEAGSASIDSPISEQLARVCAEIVRMNDTHATAAAASILEYVTDAALMSSAPDVIEGMISSGTVAALYGPSRAGKTFVALHMASCIAQGRDCFGRPTQAGAVLYVPLEGKSGIAKRIRAAVLRGGDLGQSLALLRPTGTLGATPQGAVFASKIIAAGKQLAKQAGMPLRLVVIDTVACALAGENENDASTMAALLAHCNRITAETGATVLLIAHPGKDRERGMRGSSALFAGCDNVIEIEREEGASVRNLIVRKHRDGEEGPVASFTLERVELGRDPLGASITSCVVIPTGDPTPATRRRPHDGTANGKALSELEHIIIAGNFQKSRGHARIPDGAKLVNVDDWRAACRTRRLGEGSEESESKAFRRAKQALSSDGFIGEYNSFVWPIGGQLLSGPQEGTNAQ